MFEEGCQIRYWDGRLCACLPKHIDHPISNTKRVPPVGAVKGGIVARRLAMLVVGEGGQAAEQAFQKLT